MTDPYGDRYRPPRGTIRPRRPFYAGPPLAYAAATVCTAVFAVSAFIGISRTPPSAHPSGLTASIVAFIVVIGLYAALCTLAFLRIPIETTVGVAGMTLLWLTGVIHARTDESLLIITAAGLAAGLVLCGLRSGGGGLLATVLMGDPPRDRSGRIRNPWERDY